MKPRTPVITTETSLELKTTTERKKKEEEGNHTILTPNSLFTSIVSGV